MKQVYKITNLNNMKSYIGISICESQTHMDRFEKHMTGKGGVWIKKDLDSGEALREDFVIELLEEGNQPDDYYRDMEIYYIEYFDTLYPKGYNGNKGNYIIATEEVIRKSLETRRRNHAAGLWEYKGKKGYANYRYSDGQIKQLPIDHPDIINGLVKHVNYKHDSKVRLQANAKAEQRVINNGLTDAQVAVVSFWQGFGQRMVNNENFWAGRQKMRDRHAKKEFTPAELDLHQNRRPKIIEESWKTVPRDERLNRTQAGRDSMNTKVKCEHCGINTNKGNYKRWHGNKCKSLLSSK
jgi:hypothetical protein